MKEIFAFAGRVITFYLSVITYSGSEICLIPTLNDPRPSTAGNARYSYFVKASARLFVGAHPGLFGSL